MLGRGLFLKKSALAWPESLGEVLWPVLSQKSGKMIAIFPSSLVRLAS